MYRLRHKETKQIATPEELKYLRVNTDGVVEKGLVVICYGDKYYYQSTLGGLKISSGIEWQPAPEWEVEWGYVFETQDNNKIAIFHNDIIGKDSIKEIVILEDTYFITVSNIDDDELSDYVDDRVRRDGFTVVGTIYDEVNNEASI